MKMLTISRMAAARLRANKKQYLLLVVGIFLSVLLVTALCLSAWGVMRAAERNKDLRMGSQDAFLLDCPQITDEDLENMGYFGQIGHVYVAGKVENTSAYLGWYDAVGGAFLNHRLKEGRLPQQPGEIAMEGSAMLTIWEGTLPQVGDTVELTLEPVDGLPERRSFTLVGILTEQVENLKSPNTITVSFINLFPAMLVSPEEPSFDTGRLAVHRLMSMVVPSSEELFQTFWDRTTGPYDQHFWVITALGEMVKFHYPLSLLSILSSGGMQVFFFAGLLLLALLLACGVGIAGSMEGILQQRREEIGILRALGATKRQIRRIFGRDSWLLALTVAPAGILAGCLFVWVLSLLVPDSLVFQPDPRLMLPVLAFSGAVILLSSQAPLHRAADQMPMGVLRDTRLLRRAKGLASSRSFRVPSLISRRMLRFYPSRMIGAALLAFLMCFCAGLVAGTVYYTRSALSPEDPAYRIYTMEVGITEHFASFVSDPALSTQSAAQIRQLPYISRIDINRHLPVNLLLEQKTAYPIGQLGTQSASMKSFEDYVWEQEIIAKLAQREAPDRGALQDAYNLELEQYDQDRKKLGISQEVASSNLFTIELNQDRLAQLEACLEQGHIDIDAINAGREVLVMAPKLWYMEGYGDITGLTDDPAKYSGSTIRSAGENDCFRAGMQLPMMQLYVSDYSLFFKGLDMDYSKCDRYDCTVTVGAVLNAIPDGIYFSPGGILTTEEGLRNMSLASYGWDTYHIYLTEMPESSARQELSSRVKAIARRSTSAYFIDRLEGYEESARQDAQILLAMISICLVFFAVASGMIVSTVSRQLQSDGKRIGMLRAVGAQERTIFRCYTGQVYFPLLLGAVMAGLTFALLRETEHFGIEPSAYALAIGFMLVFTASCIALCLTLLQHRVRQITRQSIIDNIREL